MRKIFIIIGCVELFVKDTFYLMRTILFVWFLPYNKADRRLHFIVTGISEERKKRFPVNLIILLYKIRLTK